MSRKNQIKRLAKTLSTNTVPPTREGLAQMIAGMGLRFRSIGRAMVRRENKQFEKGAEGLTPWTDRRVARAPTTRRAIRLNHNDRHSLIGWFNRRDKAQAAALGVPGITAPASEGSKEDGHE